MKPAQRKQSPDNVGWVPESSQAEAGPIHGLFDIIIFEAIDIQGVKSQKIHKVYKLPQKSPA